MSVNIGTKVSLDGWSEFRKDMNDMIQQQKTLKSEMKLVTSGFDKHTTAQEKARAKAQVLTKQVETQSSKVKRLKEEYEKATKELGENNRVTQKLKQQLNEATAELNDMNKELKEAQTQSSKFRSSMSALGNKIGGVGGAFKTMGNVSATAIKGIGKSLVSTTAATGAMLVALGKIGLEYNMEMESYTTSFQTMLGSAEAAASKVESLKKMAASTPFEMTDLADATQQLLAMGVANNQTNYFLQQLGDISLGNVEKFNSLVGAFGKMNSSQKVTLEYINIMAEQGFNPLNIIAEKTGETMTQLYDRVSKGKVSFEEIKAAMATATSYGGQFYKGMEQASKTTDGMISTLKDNATALVGEVFKPISEGLKDKLLPEAIDAVEELTDAYQRHGVQGMTRAAGKMLGEALGEFSGAMPEFAQTAVDIVNSLLDGIDENMDAIADGACDAVLALADGLVDMAPRLVVTGTLLIGKVAAGLIEGLPDLIEQIPEMVEEICAGFAEYKDEWAKVGEAIANGIWDALVSILIQKPSEKKLSEEAIKFFQGLGFGNSGNSGGNITRGFGLHGSHAGGLSFVPFDGYRAELHKGERVLTRQEADYFRTARDTVAVHKNIQNHFYIQVYAAAGQDEEAIAEAVADRVVAKIEQKEAAVA